MYNGRQGDVMAKAVLCYGDSNTFGAPTVPRPDARYAVQERWTGVLAAKLGSGWRVIEEGLNGRTTVRDDPVEGEWRNGKSYLLPCVLSHQPLDVVVIMLGTNDLKARFHATAWEAAEGVRALIGIIQTAGVGRSGLPPAILVVAPPPFQPILPAHSQLFAGAYEKSLLFAQCYRAMAVSAGAHFLDAGTVATSSKADGFHLDPEHHASLGEAVSVKVREMSA